MEISNRVIFNVALKNGWAQKRSVWESHVVKKDIGGHSIVLHREGSTSRLGACSVTATNCHPASCSDDVKNLPTTPRKTPKHWLRFRPPIFFISSRRKDARSSQKWRALHKLKGNNWLAVIKKTKLNILYLFDE